MAVNLQLRIISDFSRTEADHSVLGPGLRLTVCVSVCLSVCVCNHIFLNKTSKTYLCRIYIADICLHIHTTVELINFLVQITFKMADFQSLLGILGDSKILEILE